MRATVFAGIAVLAACGGTLHAQQAPTAPPAAVEPQAPDVQQPGQQPPAGSSSKQAPDSRRDDIRTMETVLTNALQKGAQDLARQLRVNQPNSAFVTGTGRARGFLLEGYGIFFDVDVPGMRQSVVWSEQMVQLMQDRERALQALARMRPDEPLRKVVELQYRQIERLIDAAKNGSVLVPSSPSPAGNTQMALPGAVNAQTVSSETVVTSAPAAPVADASRAMAVPSASVVMAEPVARDPNELYTESVKNALIEAMLKYSAFLKIGDAEWLTVAASDSEGPPVPGQLDDTSRIVIRVKGADLTAFQAGKLTREEVLKKVEVREY